jgi:hypothetical protein
MSTSESRLSYPDAQAFLDAVLADDVGARRPFPNRGAAFQFRTRCHTLRKICRIDNRKVYPDPQHPLHGRSEYDAIKIRDPIKDGEGEWWIYGVRHDIGDEEIESLSELGDATS